MEVVYSQIKISYINFTSLHPMSIQNTTSTAHGCSTTIPPLEYHLCCPRPVKIHHLSCPNPIRIPHFLPCPVKILTLLPMSIQNIISTVHSLPVHHFYCPCPVSMPFLISMACGQNAIATAHVRAQFHHSCTCPVITPSLLLMCSQ